MQKGDFLLLEIFCCVNTQPSRTRQSGVGGVGMGVGGICLQMLLSGDLRLELLIIS